MVSYLFALTDGGGTIPPEIGVARRLKQRGHRVTVFADPTMREQAEAAGLYYRPWSNRVVSEFRDWAVKNPAQLASMMAEQMIIGPAAGQAQDVVTAIDAERPDRVVTSFLAMGAMVGAQARGVPFDVLIPNTYGLPAEGMPPFGAGLKPLGGVLGRVRSALAGRVTTSVFDRYTLERLNAIRSQHGLATLPHSWDQLAGARRQLVLTSSAFDFPAVLPANAKYVGPILDDPSWAATEWTPPHGDEPLVLVALSSTFQNQVDCMQRIIEALAELPVRAVVTTGPAVQPGMLRAASNTTIVASAPHSQVIKHASLVVTHGGHGTVIKTLAAGLPLVILHHGRDQADNAVRVTERGAGVAVSRKASAAKIRRAIETVLGDTGFRDAAAKLGEQITADASDGSLARELESA